MQTKMSGCCAVLVILPWLIIMCSLAFANAQNETPLPSRNQIHENALHFIKTIYKKLGDNAGDVNQTIETFQKDFDELYDDYRHNNNGTLLETLQAWIEMRIQYLFISMEHIHRLHDVVDGFQVRN